VSYFKTLLKNKRNFGVIEEGVFTKRVHSGIGVLGFRQDSQDWKRSVGICQGI